MINGRMIGRAMTIAVVLGFSISTASAGILIDAEPPDTGTSITDKDAAGGFAPITVVGTSASVDTTAANAARGSQSLVFTDTFVADGADSGIDLGGTASLASGSFTLAAFVKPTSTGLRRVFSSYGGSGGLTSDIVILDFGFGGGGWLRGIVGTGNLTISDTGFDIFDGAYHHVALTFDGGTNTITLYFDGISVGSLIGTSPAPAFRTDIRVGEDTPNGGTNSANELFTGNIDNIVVRNVALSPAEIAALAIIPEPSSYLLMGIGMVGLAIFRRRKAHR